MIDRLIKLSSISILSLLPVTAFAEPVNTTLEEYAFDFSSIGYEITFPATTAYFLDPMTGNDYFTVSSNGYSLEARIDKLSRKGRKEFTEFFNLNCKNDFSTPKCDIELTGEVELDDKYKMIIWASKVDFLNNRDKSLLQSFK